MLKLVKRKGTPYWIARGAVNGKRIEKSTGTTQLSLAKERRDQIWLELKQDTPVERGPYTFDEAMIDYLNQGGQAQYLPKLLDYFTGIACDDITNKTLNDAALALYPAAAPATINRQLLTPMSAIINLAADSRLCLPLKVRRRQESPAREIFMTPDQAERLIEATHACRNKHFPALVTFLLGQGCRVGETLKLMSSDVHLDAGYAILRAENTKGGYERRVTLIPRVKAALSTLGTLRGNSTLFRTEHGGEYTFSGNRGGQIQSAFNACVDMAGLSRDITPHVCRHTWATWFYATTKDPLRLKREGGWKKDTWERYTKTQDPALGDDVMAHGWEFTQKGDSVWRVQTMELQQKTI